MELKQIFVRNVVDDGNIHEGAAINLQFLAAYGKAKNYSEFKTWITGRATPYYLQELTEREKASIAILKDEIDILEKITLLKSAYSEEGYLSEDDSENYSTFLKLLGRVFDEHNSEQKFRRAKLYACCTLFHKLLRFEMHRMYDSWYIGYKNRVDLNELFYVIDKVFEIIESKESLASEDEIKALYDISLDKNKLFEEIKSNRDFKDIILKLTHR
jgi:hypothetical protein